MLIQHAVFLYVGYGVISLPMILIQYLKNIPTPGLC